MYYNIARINKKTDIVENLEIADQEWIDNNNEDPNFYFIKYDVDELLPYMPYIDYKYEKEGQWFRYPPITWIGDYTAEALELFETEPELKEKLETLENGSKELGLVVREIAQKLT